MTEKQHSQLVKANWFTVVLTWIGAVVIIATGFYFNTNSTLASQKETNTRLEELIKQKVDRATYEEAVKRLDEKTDIIIQLLKDQKK